MSDHYSGFIVTLDDEIKDEHAERIIEAIRMIKHVATVEPIVATMEHHNAKAMARMDLQRELRGVLFK
jgi:Na+-translocating ferredoxin:NAD+ oxidoreductase RnfC subunit